LWKAANNAASDNGLLCNTVIVNYFNSFSAE